MQGSAADFYGDCHHYGRNSSELRSEGEQSEPIS